jgi:hypothetical protein
LIWVAKLGFAFEPESSKDVENGEFDGAKRSFLRHLELHHCRIILMNAENRTMALDVKKERNDFMQ